MISVEFKLFFVFVQKKMYRKYIGKTTKKIQHDKMWQSYWAYYSTSGSISTVGTIGQSSSKSL